MPKPYPKEFRDDVVAVARRRDPETTLKQIAADFGISETACQLAAPGRHRDGTRAGLDQCRVEENRALRRRNRLLEQENEVLRRAAAYLSQANLPGK